MFWKKKGEYVIQGELPQQLVSEESRFDLLEEALQLVELGDEGDKKDETQAVEGSGEDMLHPAMRHVPHHPLAHYHNQYVKTLAAIRWHRGQAIG
ncbi:unnamed protein product [Euphydryas editha]|uniref:Uncharacterized protein n=1 Tax=Euphydryas editha TaxID=104508 RepID=A0AAU9TDN8_EUPED|nr:unnamed protein product [Euphydryas editha]